VTNNSTPRRSRRAFVGLATLVILGLYGSSVTCAGEPPNPEWTRVADYRKRAAAAKDPVPIWVEAAADPGDRVRMEAARQLSRHVDDARIIPALESLAQAQPKERGREGPLYPFNGIAARCLKTIRSKQRWAAILRKHTTPRERLRAATEATRAEDVDLGEYVRNYLRELSDDEVVNFLLANKSYDEPIARICALRIKQGRRLYQEALKCLATAEQPFRGTREEAVAIYGDARWALSTLQYLQDPQSVPELLKVLVIDERVDPTGRLGGAAGEIIASFGAEALPKLDDYLRTQQSARGRHNAAWTVSLIGGPRAIEILQAALAREDRFPATAEVARNRADMKIYLERLQAQEKTKGERKEKGTQDEKRKPLEKKSTPASPAAGNPGAPSSSSPSSSLPANTAHSSHWLLAAGAGAAGLLLGFAAAALIFRRRRA